MCEAVCTCEWHEGASVHLYDIPEAGISDSSIHVHLGKTKTKNTQNEVRHKKIIYNTSVQFSLIKDGIYRLKKSPAHFNPSLSFPIVHCHLTNCFSPELTDDGQFQSF